VIDLPFIGDQSFLFIDLQPEDQVMETYEGSSLSAAIAVFSPSVIRTGLDGSSSSCLRLNIGLGTG
jgi:hypothetical protein